MLIGNFWLYECVDKDIKFTVTAQTGGWIGLGFSDSPNMPNSDTIVAWVDYDNVTRVLDTWVGADKVFPSEDTLTGGHADVFVLNGSQRTNADKVTTTTITFTRKLITNDIRDMDIADREIYLLWSYGQADPDPVTLKYTQHHSTGLIQVNLLKGNLNEDVDVDNSSPHTTYRTAHAQLMILGWILAIAPGTFDARYLKPFTPKWWPAHWILQSIGVLLAFCGMLSASYDIGMATTHFKNLHSLIGLGIMIATAIQVVLGVLAHFKYNPHRTEPPFFPDRVHWFFGRTALGLAFLNVYLGLHQYDLFFHEGEPYAGTGLALTLLFTLWLVIALVGVFFAERRKRQMEAETAVVPPHLKAAAAPKFTPLGEDTPTTPPKRSRQQKVQLRLGDPDLGTSSVSSSRVLGSAPPLEDEDVDEIQLDEFPEQNSEPSKTTSTTVPEESDLSDLETSPPPGHAYPAYSLLGDRLVMVLAVLHVFIVATLIGLLFSVPNDPLAQPYQFCPLCETLEYKFDNFSIPIGLHAYANKDGINNATTYACRGFLVPMDKQYHIVEMTPIVGAGQVLHHMILYAIPYDKRNDGYFDCLSMPDSAQPLFIWAPGVNGLKFPSDVGLRIGKDTDVKYLALQIHYDNPLLETTYVDSSGVRMSVTPSLRKYDGAFLFLGTDLDSIRIPPANPNFEIYGNCTKDKTKTLPYELNVFSSAPHAHKTGRLIWTEQFRNGERINWFPQKHFHYDFNDQAMTPVSLTIQPGDDFITHCVYDTSDKTEEIIGGDGTSNEMCLNVIGYYPKVDSFFCLSDAVVQDMTQPHFRPDQITDTKKESL